MNKRSLLYSFIIALALTLLAILFFDQPIAAFVQQIGGSQLSIFREGTDWLELASGYSIGKFFIGFLLLGAGGLLLIWKPARRVAWILVFIGSTHLVCRATAGVLKEVFRRLRPFEVIQAGNWDWNFFGGHGNAFPSGHSAHFWGLFFPLAFLFPRYRFPLAIAPLFITVARVGVNDHWCSDVLASAALAALITLFFAWLFRMKSTQNAHSETAPEVDEAPRNPL
jgi:membrane-associated phospholipid phosphatase